jgi:hypothetical protein
VDALTEPGVHVQVAVVEAAATDSQPVIAVPPTLNVTVPGVLTDAVITTDVPYVAVVALDGKESESVGVTCKSLDCDKDPLTVRVTKPELSLSPVVTEVLFRSNFVFEVDGKG